MTHIITSVILIIGALGLFVTFTKPRYDTLQLQKDEIASYDEALQQVSKLQSVTSRLKTESEAISPQNIDKISKAIPQNIDNVRLILEIDVLAKSLGLNASNIVINQNESQSETDSQSSAPAPTELNEEGQNSEQIQGEPVSLRLSVSSGNYNSVNMSFSVNATYDELKKLLKKLERSLRFIDIVSISSTGSQEGDGTTYTITFTTYWLGT